MKKIGGNDFTNLFCKNHVHLRETSVYLQDKLWNKSWVKLFHESHKVSICINFFHKNSLLTLSFVQIGFTFNKFLDKLKLKFSLFLPQNISNLINLIRSPNINITKYTLFPKKCSNLLLYFVSNPEQLCAAEISLRKSVEEQQYPINYYV